MPDPLFSLLASGPFGTFIDGFATFLKGIFGLILLVSLAVTVYHVIDGDREAAKKLFKWIAIGAIGYTLIEIISNLG